MEEWAYSLIMQTNTTFILKGLTVYPSIPTAKNLPSKTCMKELQDQTKMALEARFVF